MHRLTICVLAIALCGCTPALPVQLHLTHGPATAAQILADTSVWRQRLELAGAKEIKIAARGDGLAVVFRSKDSLPWDDVLTSPGDFSSGLAKSWTDLPGFGNALRNWSDTSDEVGARITSPPDTSAMFFLGIIPPQTCAKLDSFLTADPGMRGFLAGKGKPVLSRSLAKWGTMGDGYFLYVVASDARELRRSDIREVKLDESHGSEYSSVGIALTPEGGDVLKRLTTTRVGRALPILIDGKVVMCPKVMGPVPGSHLSISGTDPQQTRRLVALLKCPMLQAKWIAEP